MTNINGPYGNLNINSREFSSEIKKSDIDVEDIEFLFSTEQLEDERTDFDSTFDKIDAESKAVGGDVDIDEVDSQAQKFYQGLVDNKETLCEQLGISDDKYDSLCYVALALASQETGMGAEAGYQEENKGIGKFFRGIGKFFDVLRGGSSASSGLTQMKIYEFLNDDQLPDDKKQILQEHGIKAKRFINNNLFKEPEKAAIATIVVLSELSEKYDDYQAQMKEEHNKIGKEISNNPQELKQAEQKGNEILDTISKGFDGLSKEEQSELRNNFKQVFLSTPDNESDDFNEEIQLNKLNAFLQEKGIDVEINSETLNQIRYALTAEGKEMTPTEYLAYAWNKGTGETGMQTDRILAAKIGTIFASEDSFDADQFETNVATLAEKYANQSVGENGLNYIDDLLA